jgi:hypothetical protein
MSESNEPSNTSDEPKNEADLSAGEVSTDHPVEVSQPETRSFAPAQPETRPFTPINFNLVTATLAMLGHKGTDKVSGATGVISSVSFDLYGCVHCALTPQASDKDAFTRSYDVQRINLSDEPPVMVPPDFFSRAITPDQHAHGGIDHDRVQHDIVLPSR